MKIKLSKKAKIASTIALVAAVAGIGFLLDNLHRNEFVIENIPDNMDNVIPIEPEESFEGSEEDIVDDDVTPAPEESIGTEDNRVVNGKVNINEADETILEKINGIGASIAKRIVDYRTANGSFATVDELVKVSGIGEKKLEELREFITVE